MFKCKYIIAILFCFWIFPYTNSFAQIYKTEPLSHEIQSIEVKANGDWNSYPIIDLDSSDKIQISFDQISEDLSSTLKYKILACNADWSINKDLSNIEYLNGFDENVINDYQTSINTTVPYTHYNIQIPNKDLSLKLSGNYVVLVYDESDEDNILLSACFSILDKKTTIKPEISAITDIDANNKHHQLSFELEYKIPLRDVKNDLKVFVRQNNRLDNQRNNILPNYIMPSKLRYTGNKALIFDAGNEYKRFDMSSFRSNGKNVAHIKYVNPVYHMYIAPTKLMTEGSYIYDQDQNGRVIYRTLDGDDVATEGDYFETHFSLHADEPLKEDIYLNGAFTYNTFDDKYRMTYDEDNKEYSLSLLLKQGIYNYQFLSKDDGEYTTSQIAGSYYETENEYSIFVYYKPAGQKYDALVGFINIQSREK